jgi:tight adherence protein B
VNLLVALLFALGVGLLFDWLTRPVAPAVGGGIVRRRLRALLTRAGVREEDVREDVFALLTLGAGAVAALVAQALAGWGLVSLVAGLIGASAPILFFARKGERRAAAVEAALVDAIAQLRDSNRAGKTLEPGLALLAESGPDILRPHFARLVRDLHQRDFARALAVWQRDLANPLADTVATTLRLAHRTGGDALSEILDQLVRATRGELRMLREQRANQARTVAQARVIALMPLVLLLALRRASPEYMAPFEGGGQLVLVVALLLVVGGYAAMLRLGRVARPGRTVRP